MYRIWIWAGKKTIKTPAYLFLKPVLLRWWLAYIGIGDLSGKYRIDVSSGELAHSLTHFTGLFFFAFEKRGVLGFTSGFIIIVLLFGGALIGVWASGTSDLNIVAGLLPYNDANGYFHGGRLLAEGQPLHPFSAKRPLFPALLGVFYWISGENLQITIGILTLIVILSVFIAGREIKKISGSLAAVFFTFGLFIFLRRFIGSTMSEMLGLPLGAIGFAFLWSGASRQRLADAAAGMLLLCLGLLSRAGPFFILPLLVLWAGWGFRREEKYNWKAVAVTTAAAGLGYLIHVIIFQTLAVDSSSSMANFSYTLYGLVVGGKGWRQYTLDHPDVLSLIEPYQSRAIYLYAWEAFKAQPSGILQGAVRYWQAFFTLEWNGMFGFIEGATQTESYIGRGVMATLSVGGLFLAIKKFKNPEISMILAGIIGILLSVPFVPTLDAEIRTYAAVTPWLIGPGMLGLLGIKTFLKNRKNDQPEEIESSRIPYGLWSLAISLVFLIFVAPLLLHGYVKPREVPAVTGCTGDNARLVTMISKGSYINVLPDKNGAQSMVPDLLYTDFNKSMHDSPMFRLVLQMFPVKAGNSFFTGYNWVDRRFEDILAKTELFEENQGWVELCGWRESDPTDYGFFHAETARKINP